MFIHLGGDHIVLAKDVIAIVDYSKPETSKKIAPFLEIAEEKGTMIWISKETTKSIVITNQYIYGSPISSLTLNRRA
jgi:hypothetical protein